MEAKHFNMEPWIQLVDGRPFEPYNPKPEDFSIEVIAKALSHICRFGGHTKRFYSVAEHSVRVAGLMPDELKIYGLLHDAHEAYTGFGDVSTPVKPDSLRDTERCIDWEIAKAFDLHHSKFYDSSVRQADLQMLSTEKHWLLEPCSRSWNLEMPPPDATMDLMSYMGDPRIAEYNFLNLYRNLTNG